MESLMFVLKPALKRLVKSLDDVFLVVTRQHSLTWIFPLPFSGREREKYAFLCFHPSCLVSAVLHAATQCYLLFVSGERIWQVQYTMFIWQGKFFIPILSRKWNHLSTQRATSFLDRLIMRRRIAKLYFPARSKKTLEMRHLNKTINTCMNVWGHQFVLEIKNNHQLLSGSCGLLFVNQMLLKLVAS